MVARAFMRRAILPRSACASSCDEVRHLRGASVTARRSEAWHAWPRVPVVLECLFGCGEKSSLVGAHQANDAIPQYREGCV